MGFPLWASMSPAWQVLSEVTEDNLIDLGPGSPAVVSPTVGSTAPPSSLSSQLAGLGECPWPPPTSWPRGGRSMGQCEPGPAVPASAQGFSLSLEFEPVGNLELGGGGPRNWRLFGPEDRWLLGRTWASCVARVISFSVSAGPGWQTGVSSSGAGPAAPKAAEATPGLEGLAADW